MSAQQALCEQGSCLQGLLTNDVNQIYSNSLAIQYSAILNAHGRFLHDLFLYKQPGQH